MLLERWLPAGVQLFRPKTSPIKQEQHGSVHGGAAACETSHVEHRLVYTQEALCLLS